MFSGLDFPHLCRSFLPLRFVCKSNKVKYVQELCQDREKCKGFVILPITLLIAMLDFDSRASSSVFWEAPALPRKTHSLGAEGNSQADSGGEAARSAKLETFKFFIYSLVCSLVNSLF